MKIDITSPITTKTVDNQLDGILKSTFINMIPTIITGTAQNASQMFVWITGNSVNLESVLFYRKGCPVFMCSYIKEEFHCELKLKDIL